MFQILFVIQTSVGRIVITESHSTVMVTSDKIISLLERRSDKTPLNAKLVLVDFRNKKGPKKWKIAEIENTFIKQFFPWKEKSPVSLHRFALYG